MEYVKECKHCRKTFTTARKDKQFDTPSCKTKHWRLLNGFVLLAEWVPEKEVKEKYYVSQKDNCIIYLQWFHLGKDRFADVYMSKDCSIDVKKRFKNNKYPHRTFQNVSR